MTLWVEKRKEKIELIKEYWRSNSCTYQDLEHFQENTWGQIDFKKSTLKSIASAEGWNKEKNMYALQNIESHKNDIISQGLKSLDGIKKDITLNEIKRKGISNKYLKDLELSDLLIKKFSGTFVKKGNDLIVKENPNKSVIQAQKLKMESTNLLIQATKDLLGIRSIQEEDRLKIGLINMEQNLSDSQFKRFKEIKELELKHLWLEHKIGGEDLEEAPSEEFEDYLKDFEKTWGMDE